MVCSNHHEHATSFQCKSDKGTGNKCITFLWKLCARAVRLMHQAVIVHALLDTESCQRTVCQWHALHQDFDQCGLRAGCAWAEADLGQHEEGRRIALEIVYLKHSFRVRQIELLQIAIQASARGSEVRDASTHTQASPAHTDDIFGFTCTMKVCVIH